MVKAAFITWVQTKRFHHTKRERRQSRFSKKKAEGDREHDKKTNTGRLKKERDVRDIP